MRVLCRSKEVPHRSHAGSQVVSVLQDQVVSSYRTWNSRLEGTAAVFWSWMLPWHVWREGSVTPACLSCSSKAAKLWIHNSVSCSRLLLWENTERDHLLQAKRFSGSSEDIPRAGRIQCHEANQFCITIGAISLQRW